MVKTEPLRSVFSGANITGEDYSVFVASITFTVNIFSVFDLSKSRAVGPAQYGTEFIGPIIGDLRSTIRLTVEIRPTCLSHIY